MPIYGHARVVIRRYFSVMIEIGILEIIKFIEKSFLEAGYFR